MPLAWLRRFSQPKSRSAQRGQGKRYARPWLELLEDRVVPSTLIPVSNHRGLVFDPQRDLLYITSGNGVVQRYDLQNQALLSPWYVGASLNGADISPDDSTLYVADSQIASNDGLVHAVNLSSGAVTNLYYPLLLGEGGSWDVVVGPQGTALVDSKSYGPSPLRQLDLNTGTFTIRTDDPGSGGNGLIQSNSLIQRSADRSLFFVTESNNSAGPEFLYDANANAFLAGPNFGIDLTNALSAVNRNGSLLAIEYNGTALVFNTSYQVVAQLPNEDGGVAFDPVRDILYAASSATGEITAFDTNTWAVKYQMAVGERVTPAATFGNGVMAVSNDGSKLFLGTSNGVRMFDVSNAAPAVALAISGTPQTTTAGTTGTFTVGALDSTGQIASSYRGTVHFSSSDPAAVLPADYTFTASDNGVHTFTCTLTTAGSQWLVAADTSGSINAAEVPISVTPGALDHFQLSAPQYAASYYAFNVSASARDAYNNTITGYTGTVHFTSSDSAASLPADYTFTSGDQGVHTFSVTLQTTGNQTISTTDTGTGVSGTATVQDVDYVPGLHFQFGVPSTTTAGVPFSVTITALDEYNKVATHYDGTVALSSTDRGAGAVAPANYTFTSADAGVHTFFNGFTLVTAGTQSVTAEDISTVVTGGYGYSSSNITVVPAALSTLALTGFPTSMVAGSTKSFTVAGLDAYGNVVTSYNGTIHFTSTDAQAVLPSDTALSNGAGTFSAVLKTAGAQSLTASDTANSALTVTQNTTVNPGAAVQLGVTGFPTPSTAGVAGTFTVTALDAYGNTATGYGGKVHFTSSDPQGVLPANAALTNGTGTFSATLKTAGTQSLTATDTAVSGLNGTQSAIVVAPAAANSLVLTGFPASITAGVAGSFTVTVKDAYGNTATAYTGTVHFTASDAHASLPADYTFSASDQGAHTFTATLTTAGTQSLAVADTAGSLAGGSEGGIAVNAAAAVSLSATAPANVTAGAAFAPTVWAVDAYGNQATGYTGTVHFSSSDPRAALSADYTFNAKDAGRHVFLATLLTAGNQTLTVSDTGSSGVRGTQLNINVAAGATSAFALSGFPATVTAGVAQSFTVTVTDAYGNVTTGYTGSVHFSSSDSQAVLPANYTFIAADAGAHSFSAALKTAGSQALFVQDTVQYSISGIYWSTVTAAPASWIAAYYPSSTTAGAAQNLTVYAYDPYGNVATGYNGTVHVTSSDAHAILPADYTFTASDAGVHTLSVTLKTAGIQSITVQDGHNGFTRTAGGIAVNAAAASQLTMSNFPSATTAGAAGTLTVTAYDAYGNIAKGYSGTVHFTSSDAQAGLPSDYTFTSSDQGVHTFSASLKTAGTQSLTVTDTANSSLTASKTGVTVVAAAFSQFLVSGFPATTAGVAHTFTVTATDAYGNLVSNYTGSVHFTSSDAKANLPGNYTFNANDKGVHTFSATLKTAGAQSLTATDTSSSSITGSESGINVSAAAATTLTLSAPATASVGTAISVTVTARDAYGNVATGYLGTIHFTSSDDTAVLPANYTFLGGDAGVHVFTVTFKKSGTQNINATDTKSGSIKGSASVKVS
jgi:hypothetical protein